MQELRIENKLYDAQCQRLKRFAPQTFECNIPPPNMHGQFRTLTYELSVAFLITTLFSLLLSYLLARLSLRPMHEAYEMMDGFVHAMIHDLNTPIAAAKLSAEGMKRSELSLVQQRKLLRIQQSLQRLMDLQSHLRMSIHKAHFHYADESFMLNKLLYTYTEYAAPIRVQCDNTLNIYADKVMISRMIENLLANAIKYNREAHQIDVTLHDAHLTISDNGLGIKDTRRIFESYYRETSSVTGLGLGLGIVKMVSDHYGLQLHIQSQVNIGTTVKLDFTAVALQKAAN